MADFNSTENDFLIQITAFIRENLSDEQFGVTELADKMNMSRSNLLRKVKKHTNLSVSQLISQVRLQRGMELLRKATLNVSEVSHEVGFSSTSYFIKCFREYYGYPPGEVGKKDEAELITNPTGTLPSETSVGNKKLMIAAITILTVLIIGLLTYVAWPSKQTTTLEKSIAVLPFINDSNDSTNVYLINGLMETTLNNLQQIKELKVISRTSAEKYRNTSKSIPEIAEELNVNYIVEGSGQKMGDRILLNIQLIEASTDRHLWGNQYRKESKDIFELQQEVAKNIALEIQAIITPDEQKRIEKKPTNDLQAYDLFLKGMDLLAIGGTANLEKSITYFDDAIRRDPQFAMAYAKAAVSFYYLDFFKKDKKYIGKLTSYADKALLLDPKLAESLIAKAFGYMNQQQYEAAASYLEKALEYNPNSILAISMLADFYCNYIPNTNKYLEYALKGVKLDEASQDSVTTSYNYLRLANALIQNGFVDESLTYINKSLVYNAANPFSSYVKAFILYAKNGNLAHTRELLITEFEKDTSRFDILQDIGKVSYYLRDFKEAYRWDKRFIRYRETMKLDVFKHENLRMAYVAAAMGDKAGEKELLAEFKKYADTDHSIYKSLAVAMYHCYHGEYKQCIENMKLFTKEDNYQYWIVIFMDKDPVVDPIKDLPEFKNVMRQITDNFWGTNKQIRLMLEDKGLL